MKSKSILFLILFSIFAKAQELNPVVTVNFDKVTGTNTQVFKTLEKQVLDFLTNTKFTNKQFSNLEKINCSFYFIVNKYENNTLETTLQVSSTRPIFNSTFTSPILNLNDSDVNFKYIEFENLVYDQNLFTSNLVSVLSFYANIIIASDLDSFSKMGGSDTYEVAQDIASVAQSSGFSGWVQATKKPNRYSLISDLMSNTFDPYREALYDYHLKGLDVFADEAKLGKAEIINAIEKLYQMHKVRPNSLLARTFFDAKSDEVVSIFSAGPSIDVSKVKDMLQSISTSNSAKWNKIK